MYLFLALAKTTGVAAASRAAGILGFCSTAAGLGAAFLPTADVTSVPLFEAKMVVGVVGPTSLGWVLFKRAQQAQREVAASRYNV